MEVSHKTKLVIFVILLTVFILGAAMFGPKFIYKIQLEFGFKGKIERIEECILMPGCAITTDELDLYNHYKILEKNKTFKELEKTELGNILIKRETNKEQ